jgi:hypothetical protein
MLSLGYKSLVPNETPKPPESAPRPLPAQFAATSDPSVAKIYTNGFLLGFTNSDTQLILLLSGSPVAVVNFSYTLAKTMVEKLGKLVEDWEKKTGHPLQTTDSIDKAFGVTRPEGPK